MHTMKASLVFLCGLLFCTPQCAISQEDGGEQVDGIGGADSAYFLMEIDIINIRKPRKVVQSVVDAMKSVSPDTDGGELIWIFKVLGENSIKAVTKDTPEPFWEAVTDVVGCSVTIKTTPLKPYEHFAQSINNVDPALCGPSPRKLKPGINERLYYVDAIFTYRGFTIEDLRNTWPKESNLMLGDRAAGKIQIEFFKVIGTNRVTVFIVAHPDALDDLTFLVPLVVDLGDNSRFPLDEIVPL